MSFFNPASPRYQRGIILTSFFSCSLASLHILLSDFGSQEHVFSPIQRFLIPQIDSFFQVSDNEFKEMINKRNLKDNLLNDRKNVN